MTSRLKARISRVRKVLKDHAIVVNGQEQARHEDMETKITDLITDLLHLAKVEGVSDIRWLLDKSHDHFRAESAQ